MGQRKKSARSPECMLGGGTDFDVAFSDNANSQMSFSIANIGSNPANSVSVVIPRQRDWSVSGSNSVIIGNLNKGDYAGNDHDNPGKTYDCKTRHCKKNGLFNFFKERNAAG